MKTIKRKPRCFELMFKKCVYMSRVFNMNGWMWTQTAPPTNK